MKVLYTTIFVHKETGKTLKVFTGSYLNKYFYEKEKREMLTRLVKAKDIPPDEIDIIEHVNESVMTN